MATELNDLHAFMAVAKARGFRQAARGSTVSASRLSDAIRRLEAELGVRLFHRTTRSVVLTEAGAALFARMSPAMSEIEAALDSVNDFRDRPAGKLRLNVPTSAARLILTKLVPGFLSQYPDIELEVEADSNLVNIFDAGFDAGVRYDERLEQDMIAVPIGPRVQRFAVAASADFLREHGMPSHPRELINYPCILGKFQSGVIDTWEFENNGNEVSVKPKSQLIISFGGAVDVGIQAAIAGNGLIMLFEEWLQPYFDSGELVPVLSPWWLSFSGPFLYYSDRRLVPSPLRAFIDYVKANNQVFD